MADQTFGAVNALLGVLATAIKDEARLVGGVPGNMQFIKDEMDSMNGFLMHLTKTESEHDDQLRAWMKQVREIANIAEDCVELYVRDILPHDGDGGILSMIRLFLVHQKTYWKRHKLGKQILELKVRVQDVGERRQRYGVTVPSGQDLKLAQKPGHQDDWAEEERREAFQQALEEIGGGGGGSSPPALGGGRGTHQQAQLRSDFRRAIGGLLPLPAGLTSVISSVPAALRYLGMHQVADADPYFNAAIRQLLPEPLRSEAATVRDVLKKCSPDLRDEAHTDCMKMFLGALFVYPYATSSELQKLWDKLEERAEDPRRRVMVFCYSMLSTQQKSCLQYLTAFLEESEISRTSLVRRWVAEKLVGKEQGRTPEEAGERCFSELVFRGFIRPWRFSDAGTVKSCVLHASIRDFIFSMAGSENFVVELPAHLKYQLEIRKIAQRPRRRQQLTDRYWSCRNIIRRGLCCCCCCGGGIASRSSPSSVQGFHARMEAAAASDAKDPMDELVGLLNKLPQLYRLNVLDLGGCTGLKRSHLKNFCKAVAWLKYLSLRNTDVSCLEASDINKLTLLETLDIRGTNIPHSDMKEIYLPRLKHLLAGRYTTASGSDANAIVAGTGTGTATARRSSAEKVSLTLHTVEMPKQIGKMREMETLSHVQVSNDGAELAAVARLVQLRKLGVVIVHGSDLTGGYLGQVIHALAACLRSLSIRVRESRISDISIPSETTPSLILENLDIKGKMGGLPSWIGRADRLANVTLCDTEMNGGDTLRRLSSVPSLRCLKLSRKAFTVQALHFKDDVQFRALKFLVVECDAIKSVAFDAADAAPVLEKITWTIGGGGGGSGSTRTHNEDLISGIDKLSSLKEIVIRGNFKLTKLLVWTGEQAAHANPSQARYHCCYKSSFDGKLIKKVPKFDSDTTLSLPADVIDLQ